MLQETSESEIYDKVLAGKNYDQKIILTAAGIKTFI